MNNQGIKEIRTRLAEVERLGKYKIQRLQEQAGALWIAAECGSKFALLFSDQAQKTLLGKDYFGFRAAIKQLNLMQKEQKIEPKRPDQPTKNQVKKEEPSSRGPIGTLPTS